MPFMTMVRQTRQRAAVIEVLQTSRTHPDAAQVHAQVREKLPSVSLGTVYRTLDALVRDGVLVTIERAGQATRYDYRHEGEEHHHAVCRSCGAIFDVAVDVRAGSPTFGQWVSAELTAEGGEQLWVPRGFAHAYCTITDDCEIFYKVDGPYAPQSEGGIIWNDPDLAIPWPLDGEPKLSEKDKVLPRLKDLGPVQF